MAEMKFEVQYCETCQGDMVICPKCGNNCCNGGYGLMNQKGEALPWNSEDEGAVPCDICPLAYQYQDLYWESIKETNIPDTCYKCGCQIKDPFGSGEVIHDVDKCLGKCLGKSGDN